MNYVNIPSIHSIIKNIILTYNPLKKSYLIKCIKNFTSFEYVVLIYDQYFCTIWLFQKILCRPQSTMQAVSYQLNLQSIINLFNSTLHQFLNFNVHVHVHVCYVFVKDSITHVCTPVAVTTEYLTATWHTLWKYTSLEIFSCQDLLMDDQNKAKLPVSFLQSHLKEGVCTF